MGQRFQAFVIAKVVPHGGTKAYYRCVVAWHHQWCDQLLPMYATARFIRLLKNEHNSKIVRHELAAIQGKYGRSGQKPRMINAPCGYLAFLLAQAWNFDLEDNYISGTSFLNSLLPADMGSMDGDNNDGIAVIDVTDPSHPRYSFASFQQPGLVAEPSGMSPHFLEDEWEDVEEDVTSDAVDKVEVAKVERKLVPKAKFAETLSRELVVTPEMYAEAWPQEYAMPKETSEPVAEEPESQARVPPLAELTTGPAVDAAIAAGDTTGIEDLVWMPEKMALIKVALEKHVPFPDVGIPLLLQILKNEFTATHSLNLSRYALGADQIATIIKDFVEIDSLTLPAKSTVDINTVRTVLTAIPRLRRLVLFDTGVSPDDLALLIADEPKLFYFIEDLVHPYIYKHGPKKGAKYFSAFSYAALKEASNGSGLRLVQGAPLRLDLPGPDAGGASVTSIPLLHPAHVVQGLTDILSTYVVTVPEYDQLFSGIIAGTASQDFLPQVALASGIRAEGRAWGDRRVSSFPKICSNCLRGEGWMFAVKIHVQATGYMQMFSMLGLGGGGGGGGNSESYYGFVKVEKSGEHLICDLVQFLRKMEEEGRPKPTPEAVQRLEKVLSELKAQKNLRLITQAEVASIARV